MTYYPTKENLINDYYELNLSHQQIAEKYGFKTRQVIHRLFKKHNIKSKSKKEISKQNFNTKHILPLKEELEILYENKSISEISKIYNIHRNTLSKLMDEYGITKTYFKNKIDNNILKQEASNLSLKELSIKYSVDIRTLKNRLNEIPFKLFTREKIINILSLYNINSPSFARDVSEDPNLYNSIIELTKNHYLQSNKITERIYRIIHNIEPKKVFKCKVTNEPLKFYTLSKGYGNSNLNVSKNGFVWTENFNLGYLKISQKLFWEIYNRIDKKYQEKIKFSELNYEVKIKVDYDDFINKLCDNKYSYIADFIMDNKNIEFDGDYWHGHENIKLKDKKRDKYLTSKGYEIMRVKECDYIKNPENVITECINFLTK